MLQFQQEAERCLQCKNPGCRKACPVGTDIPGAIHKLREGTEKGLLKVDAEGRTTVPGVFAAGDVVHGGRTVVEAVAGAKITAQVMEEYMMRKGNGQ